MAVAVQGRRAPEREENPLDLIIKGLDVAKSVYGLSTAGDAAKALVEEKATKKKQEDMDFQTKLVGGGMKLDDTGKVVADTNSEFYKKKTQEKDSSLADAIKLMTLKEFGNKAEEKKLALQTPYGPALTADDAKNVKSADEEKKNFDNKISQMIKLREDAGGGALLDRESVARGKQLSKDALLSYKNMAKLGVLSSSDEAIINAIIPEDPLQFNSPVEAMQGQDSTLFRLKKFKEDSDKDFSTRLENRLRGAPITKDKELTPGITPEEAQQELLRRQGLKATIPKGAKGG